MPSPEVVVLGNLLVDDSVFPDGSTRMRQPGGAALYFALGAALWNVRVGIVSWRGSDYPEDVLAALERLGVDLAGVHALGRPGVRTWLLYEERRRQIVHRLDGPTHADVSPGIEQIPSSWLASDYFHVAPMPVAIQRAVCRQLAQSASKVTLDPYVLVEDASLPTVQELASNADAFFLSDDEMGLGATLEARLSLLSSLFSGRLGTLFFKRGAHGGSVSTGHGSWRHWLPRTNTVVDPTGAGDAFAAGVIAGWLRGETEERAVLRGVVGASFAIEAWGTAGLLAATPAAAEERFRSWSHQWTLSS